MDRYVSETEKCENCKYESINCLDRWQTMNKVIRSNIKDMDEFLNKYENMINCWEAKFCIGDKND